MTERERLVAELLCPECRIPMRPPTEEEQAGPNGLGPMEYVCPECNYSPWMEGPFTILPLPAGGEQSER